MVSLSENQCGMETRVGDTGNVPVYVEREPMWDGNNQDLTTTEKLRMVEREPMWDGNSVGNDLSLLALE